MSLISDQIIKVLHKDLDVSKANNFMHHLALVQKGFLECEGVIPVNFNTEGEQLASYIYRQAKQLQSELLSAETQSNSLELYQDCITRFCNALGLDERVGEILDKAYLRNLNARKSSAPQTAANSTALGKEAQTAKQPELSRIKTSKRKARTESESPVQPKIPRVKEPRLPREPRIRTARKPEFSVPVKITQEEYFIKLQELTAATAAAISSNEEPLHSGLAYEFIDEAIKLTGLPAEEYAKWRGLEVKLAKKLDERLGSRHPLTPALASYTIRIICGDIIAAGENGRKITEAITRKSFHAVPATPSKKSFDKAEFEKQVLALAEATAESLTKAKPEEHAALVMKFVRGCVDASGLSNAAYARWAGVQEKSFSLWLLKPALQESPAQKLITAVQTPETYKAQFTKAITKEIIPYQVERPAAVSDEVYNQKKLELLIETEKDFNNLEPDQQSKRLRELTRQLLELKSQTRTQFCEATKLSIEDLDKFPVAYKMYDNIVAARIAVAFGYEGDDIQRISLLRSAMLKSAITGNSTFRANADRIMAAAGTSYNTLSAENKRQVASQIVQELLLAASASPKIFSSVMGIPLTDIERWHNKDCLHLDLDANQFCSIFMLPEGPQKRLQQFVSDIITADEDAYAIKRSKLIEPLKKGIAVAEDERQHFLGHIFLELLKARGQSHNDFATTKRSKTPTATQRIIKQSDGSKAETRKEWFGISGLGYSGNELDLITEYDADTGLIKIIPQKIIKSPAGPEPFPLTKRFGHLCSPDTGYQHLSPIEALARVQKDIPVMPENDVLRTYINRVTRHIISFRLAEDEGFLDKIGLPEYVLGSIFTRNRALSTENAKILAAAIFPTQPKAQEFFGLLLSANWHKVKFPQHKHLFNYIENALASGQQLPISKLMQLASTDAVAVAAAAKELPHHPYAPEISWAMIIEFANNVNPIGNKGSERIHKLDWLVTCILIDDAKVREDTINNLYLAQSGYLDPAKLPQGARAVRNIVNQLIGLKEDLSPAQLLSQAKEGKITWQEMALKSLLLRRQYKVNFVREVNDEMAATCGTNAEMVGRRIFEQTQIRLGARDMAMAIARTLTGNTAAVTKFNNDLETASGATPHAVTDASDIWDIARFALGGDLSVKSPLQVMQKLRNKEISHAQALTMLQHDFHCYIDETFSSPNKVLKARTNGYYNSQELLEEVAHKFAHGTDTEKTIFIGSFRSSFNRAAQIYSAEFTALSQDNVAAAFHNFYRSLKSNIASLPVSSQELDTLFGLCHGQPKEQLPAIPDEAICKLAHDLQIAPPQAFSLRVHAAIWRGETNLAKVTQTINHSLCTLDDAPQIRQALEKDLLPSATLWKSRIVAAESQHKEAEDASWLKEMLNSLNTGISTDKAEQVLQSLVKAGQNAAGTKKTGHSKQ